MQEEFIDLPFFKEGGWIKRKCPVCGRVFWTLNPERKVCGDQPCEEYGFIGKRLGRGVESLGEVRRRFIEFFEKNGHTPIRRYPVVARWRDDVYLVGASIYDFQPWVTEGLVEPPANPLVISQPSIRLTDVDNVGRTGRHLTGFEMMAHHAFNVRGQRVYWANETVEYAYRLFTEVYGIPPEEITFVFDMWSGGGNAGEDYEVLVRGLELATLVFMHYKTVEGRLVPIENKIVDTGYGLERIYWFLQGSTSVYEAVFPGIIEWLRREAGLEPLPADLRVALAKRSGRLDFKKPLEAMKVFEEISSEVGMDVDEVSRLLRPFESIYALADHSRTIMWMIGDGVVPSNTGSGYLARLLIRRSMRHLRRLGLEIGLVDVVSRQLEEWRSDFPEYWEIRDEILDIVAYEEEKYRETLSRGSKIVDNLLSRYKRRGEIPGEELVKLYESHGVPPDLVEEKASSLGVRVDTTGFYSKLAELKEKSGREAIKPEEWKLPPEYASRFPETRKLYYENEKLFRFKARVIGVVEGKYVVLDATAFYPEGGGQLSDKGLIRHGGGECEVSYVFRVGGVVFHECRGPLPSQGEEVEGLVDSERRLTLMRHHTSTHVVLGALRRVLGRHVWQAGAQKTLDYVRFDFTHHRPITEEQARKIEELANRVVMENRRVKKAFMSRTEAEKRYGFSLYQGGVVPEKILRVVEIEGWDAEACGGTHCDYTGEIGVIKIVGFDKIQDGVFRVIFKAGVPAVRYIQEIDSRLKRVARLLDAPLEEVDLRVAKELEEKKRLQDELKRLENIRLLGEAERLAAKAVEVSGVKLVAGVVDEEKLRDLALETARRIGDGVVVLANPKGRIVVKVSGGALKKIDARELGRRITEKLGGRGGGVSDLFQGKIASVEGVAEAAGEVLGRLAEKDKGRA